MHLFKKLLIILAVTMAAVTGFCQSSLYDPNHLFTVSELQSDFKYLQKKLENKHPNLYLYTSKAEFDHYFDSLYKTIVKPMTVLEFYHLITLLNSKIKDGHTMMLPGEEAVNYFNSKAKFMPLYLVVIDKKLYVKMNCSSDTLLKEGDEVLSINGVGTTEIMQQLLARQVRDGHNETYPNWILSNYFKEYFSFSFGHPNGFTIRHKNESNAPAETTINALSKDSIKFYKKTRYATGINNPTNSLTGQGIILNIDKERKTATLTIKSFDNRILKSEYHQNFEHTITDAFKQVQDSNIQYLILDIRNNQGGDFEPGRLLLSYLLSNPIEYLPNSNEQRTIIPKANCYRGKLYILVNGGSFSNSGIVSSYLESAGRGIFVGEETAGNRTILSGNPITKSLPNTKIECQISASKFMISNAINDGHGVIPAHYITPGIVNILRNEDLAKDFVLKLISEDNKKNKTIKK
jgi:Peptidase family S41